MKNLTLHRSLFRLGRNATIALAIASLPILYGINVVAEVGFTTSPLTGGTQDSSTPERNATVWVGGCTGTLIKPDMIVTAGHCINRRGPAENYKSNVWYSVSLLENRRWADIRFGVNQRAPLRTATATHFAVFNGVDIGLFLLSAPIDSSIAKPVPVLLDASRINWSRQRFRQAGWGQTSSGGTQPVIRRTGVATLNQWPCNVFGSTTNGMFCVSGETVLPGDSGGPLYWTDRSGSTWLIGVAQGDYGRGGRYVPTFLGNNGQSRNNATGAVTNLPNIASFLSWNTTTSRCSLLKYSERILQRGFVRLVRWYSPGRGDNFTTTEAVWQGCRGDSRTPDYRFSKVEGVIFHPESRPPGTIPLYSWYSHPRGDNWTTAQHADKGSRGHGLSPNYQPPKLLGYIYPPNYSPVREDMVPLYRWYSPGREDNWTTTLHADAGRSRAGLSPDYRFSRLEGYILRDRSR